MERVAILGRRKAVNKDLGRLGVLARKLVLTQGRWLGCPCPSFAGPRPCGSFPFLPTKELRVLVLSSSQVRSDSKMKK